MPKADEPQSLTDAQLLGRAAELEPDALAELYARHAEAALSLATAMVGFERGGPVVEDAFERIWRNAVHFDPSRGTLRSWLLKLVRGICLDELRRLDSSERHQLVRPHDKRPDRRCSPEPSAHWTAGSAQDRAVLDGLSEDERQVIERIYFGGWTRTEVAEQLQEPEETINRRIAAAFERMRNNAGAGPREAE